VGWFVCRCLSFWRSAWTTSRRSRTASASQSATQIEFSRKPGRSRTEGLHLGELTYK
jgi:hypothetical protein